MFHFSYSREIVVFKTLRSVLSVSFKNKNVYVDYRRLNRNKLFLVWSSEMIELPKLNRQVSCSLNFKIHPLSPLSVNICHPDLN